MTEILTESFCERCGTRYTFEPVEPRRKALRGIGTLGRGLRHFVSDPGSTIDEAMAVARSEQEQRSTANALEAFHRTFNFCLSCRQYTCADCWNPVEGRCFSCAPTPEAAQPVARADTAVALEQFAQPPMDLAPTPVPLPGAPGGPDIDAGQAVMEAQAPDGAREADRVAAEAAAERTAAEEAAEREVAELLEAEARAQAEADAAAAAERMADVAAEAAAAAHAAHAAAEEDAARVAAAEQADRLAAEEARAQAEAGARAAAQAEAEAVASALAQAEAAAVAATQAAEERARIEEEARAEAEARAATEAAAAIAAMKTAGPSSLFEPGLNLDEQIAAYERQHAGLPAAPEPAAPEPAAREPEPDASASATEPAAPAAEPPAPAPEPIPTAIGRPIPASVVESTPPSWPDPEVAAAAFEPHWPDIPAVRSAPPEPIAPASTRAAAVDEAPGPPAGAHACPSCGLSLSATARFCRRCGTPQQVNAAR